MTAPVYNDTSFRQQFPAFSSTTAYPPAALAFAWNMGANWVSQAPASCWGVGAVNSAKLQQAADLMGAVIVRQLYGPSKNGTIASTGTPSPMQDVTAGPITSASNVDTSATITIPSFGSSAFRAMLLASPPYGTLLLSLLQISAGPGPYIPSGRPSWIPP